MFWSSVSAFQSPCLPIDESNCDRRNVSSMSHLPSRNDAYWPPPRFVMGPYELTVDRQFGTLRSLPTFVAICLKTFTIWQASLTVPYVSSSLPFGSLITSAWFGGALPVAFLYMSTHVFQFWLSV